MSIRVIAAAVITAAAMTIAMCGTAVAATSPAARPAVQLTGVQLLSALLPQSDFPAGYKLGKPDVYDSGRYLENSPAKYHLSTMPCGSFARTLGSPGFGETAIALDNFEKDKFTREYFQQAYQFKTRSTATTFFEGVFAVAHRCPSFILFNVSDVHTHVFDASPIGGHRTFQVNQSAFLQGHVRIAVDIVITVAGTDVFSTANFGVSVAPPSSPSARTSMLRLVTRVEAFR